MSRRKILWAPSAIADLKNVYDYIRQDSDVRASSFTREILNSVEKLARFEKLGRIIPELGQSRYRELILGEYRIFHEVRQREVLIFRVLHSKRIFF